MTEYTYFLEALNRMWNEITEKKGKIVNYSEEDGYVIELVNSRGHISKGFCFDLEGKLVNLF